MYVRVVLPQWQITVNGFGALGRRVFRSYQRRFGDAATPAQMQQRVSREWASYR